MKEINVAALAIIFMLPTVAQSARTDCLKKIGEDETFESARTKIAQARVCRPSDRIAEIFALGAYNISYDSFGRRRHANSQLLFRAPEF